MLFHYLKNPESSHYFEQLCLELAGTVDNHRFASAWNGVVQTNEMLRTVFRWEKMENPTQVVLREHRCDITFHDLSGETEPRRRDILEDIKREDRLKGFDLHQVPFRLTLCKLQDQSGQGLYSLVISNHHILYDGWSTGIILQEFLDRYNGGPTPGAKTPYKEFLRWNRGRDRDAQKQFWQNYLEGFDLHTHLPVKNTAPPGSTPGKDVEEIHFSLPPELTGQLNGFMNDTRLTPAALFYFTWGVLLQKYCDSSDVVFGSTVSGRSAPVRGIEHMVGLFINTLPFRFKTPRGLTVLECLHWVKGELGRREPHEHTPLVDIGKYGSGETDDNLFDSLLVIENYPLEGLLHRQENRADQSAGPFLALRSYSVKESTNYAFNVAVSLGDPIEIRLIYDGKGFEKSLVRRLSHHMLNILDQATARPGHTIADIDILTAEEKQQLLTEFNDLGETYPTQPTAHGLFGGQVEKIPHHIALVGGQNSATQLTFQQLDRDANQVALGLQKAGIGPDGLVGLLTDRTIEMISGLLGILKTGSGYVPLNPKAPAARNAYILEDCRINVLVTGSGDGVGTAARTYHVTAPARDEAGEPRAVTHDSSRLAYVIYTSGSTGEPKGVPISHANLSPLLHWGYRHVPLTPRDRGAQNLSYYFDWSVWEIFIILTSGSALYVVPNTLLTDGARYADFINRHGISVLHITPTHFQALTHAGQRLSPMKHLAIGAEKLTYDLVKRSFAMVADDCRVYNMYGPTEATIMAAVLEIDRQGFGYYKHLSSVPIGPTLGNTELLVLDKHHTPCPLYVPGELYIGGDALSRGYLNNPEQAADKFVPLSKSHRSYRAYRSHRFYKTGDRVRWLADGTVEFLGRIDQQAKIRGFRIEPGEIENHLLDHPKVKEALVMMREYPGGERYLCAYIVHADGVTGGTAVQEIKDHLTASLPDYMVPAHFVELDRMPLNPNGKVDLRALPEPGATSRRVYTAPENDTQKQLAKIWARVLEISADTIGLDDDFFELGGHSLSVTRLTGLIHRELNTKMSFTDIFVNPTIREQAEQITGAVDDTAPPAPEPVEEREYYPLPPVQKRIHVMQQLDPDSTAYNIQGFLEVEGTIDVDRFTDLFRRLIRRHESLRMSFINLGGDIVQRVHPDVPFEIQRLNAPAPTADSDTDPGDRLIKRLIEKFVRPFDLTRAPLLRVGIGELGKNKHLLMVDMHHIIADGTSTGILVREFTTLYSGGDLPAPRTRYNDFAAAQDRAEDGESMRQQRAYWLKQFAGEPPVLNLPGDFPRPPVQEFAGAHTGFVLDRETTNALKNAAREQNITLYMMLSGLFFLLLHKVTGQEDIVAGIPVVGREHPDSADIIGMFVNTLALRCCPMGDKPANDFLKEVKDVLSNALANQDYPLEHLVEQVLPTRDPSRNPLFDVMFAMQDQDLHTVQLPGLTLTPRTYDNGLSKFDLSLICEGTDPELRFTMEYSTNIFTEETIRRFIGFFKRIAAAVPGGMSRNISALEMISDSERQKIMEQFNREPGEYPAKTVTELFREKVAEHPDHCACYDRGNYITYTELDKRSDLLAERLKEL